MQPGASVIDSIDRASQLFPPIPCAQCHRTGRVQRYGRVKCENCDGQGIKDSAPCQKCQQEKGQPGTGFIQVPESIPCPACNGKTTRDRVRQTAPTTLEQIKVGDLLQIAVLFNTPRPEDLPAGIPHTPERAELITCMVTGGTRDAIEVLVHSAPDYGQFHGLRFRSQMTIRPIQILHHYQSTPEEIEKAKSGNLFQRDLPLRPAAPGEYFTRGGSRATVYTVRNQDDGTQIAIGKVDGVDHDWQPTGQSRSNPACDLVALSTGTAYVAE